MFWWWSYPIAASTPLGSDGWTVCRSTLSLGRGRRESQWCQRVPPPPTHIPCEGKLAVFSKGYNDFSLISLNECSSACVSVYTYSVLYVCVWKTTDHWRSSVQLDTGLTRHSECDAAAYHAYVDASEVQLFHWVLHNRLTHSICWQLKIQQRMAYFIPKPESPWPYSAICLHVCATRALWHTLVSRSRPYFCLHFTSWRHRSAEIEGLGHNVHISGSGPAFLHFCRTMTSVCKNGGRNRGRLRETKHKSTPAYIMSHIRPVKVLRSLLTRLNIRLN